MGGKTTVITLNPDMTFTEKKKKTDANNVKLSQNNAPSFTLGRSVFRELVPTWRKLLLGKKPRNLLIYLEGANSCFDLDSDGELESHKSHLWSREEKEKFINKLVVKLKARQQPFTNIQFFALAGIGIFIIVLQVLILRGLPIAI